MRVLHISAGAMWGGVERMLVTLARERSEAPDMHPHFAVCFRGRLSQELRAAGSPVDYLGEVRASRPLTVLSARRALRTVLAQETIDVAICHLPWAHAIFAPVLEAAKVPHIFWMHGFAAGSHWTEIWAKRITPKLVIANSQATAKTAPRLFPNTRVEVLYCPVSLNAEPRAETAGTIVQIGRMERWKGHEVLLDALALLRDDLNWTCQIAGGAQTSREVSYMADLAIRAQKLGIAKRVEFLGQLTDVGQLLSGASIFCQPNSGPEPFGIAMVEALAAGVPVVTSNIGAAPEIVDSTCGVLTAPRDPQPLADALRSLLTDPARRNAMGAGGPARAAELCSPARQLPALARLIQAVKLESRAA